MRSFVMAVAAVSMMVVGCVDKHHGQTRSQTKVDGALLSFEDFDLETVVGLVKSNKVSGAQELETFVNGDNGVNNVDVDKDSKIDYISVVEGRDGQNITLDFVAQPSSGEGETVTVANLKFSQTVGSEQLTVEGGYPGYVRGHDSHFYSYHQRRSGITAGEAMFMMWLMTPGRSMYMHPIPVYSPRPTLSNSALSSRRAVTRTTNKVSPVPKTTRPASYSVKSAQKTQSKLKSQGSSAFRTRAYNKQKKQAAGFGAKSNSKTTKPAPKKKSGWGSTPSRRSRPSRSRPSRSRGSRRSSILYKSDVTPSQSGLEVIKQLQPVSWQWKKNQFDTIKVQAPAVGFIAEDVAKVMPELVYTKDGKIEGINYDLIVVPLVNAVKTQQAKIDQLSNDLEQLKNIQRDCR